MGSPSTTVWPASLPRRRRLTIGPGPLSGGSKLNRLRPHGPEKSGTPSGVAARAGQSTAKPHRMISITPIRAISEIRLFSLRDWLNFICEIIEIVFRAGAGCHRPLSPALEPLHGLPFHIECARIIDRDTHLKGVAAVNYPEAFHDMKLRRMRCPVIVHKGFVVHTDRIHDQLIPLVMADGFSVPRRFRVLRVRDIKIDVPNLLIAR